MRHTYALMFALLVTAAFTSGCRSENYYCNADGCFLCDGLGCRPVDGPPRPDCNGDYECSGDRYCADVGCVTECGDDSDCPMGTECRDGSCLNPTEPDPVPNPGTCTRTADCPAGQGLVCVNGVCQVDNACGGAACECSATAPCANGFTCIDGECRADTTICHFSHECGGGRICVNGECREGCDTAATCPVGQTCEDSVCVDLPPVTGECDDNSDCSNGEVCIDSVCETSCTSDAACTAEQYCHGGVCVYDDRPQPFCTSSAQCQPGRPCVGGVCRTPCETSPECLSFDVQFRVCQNNFCVTSNEATSNCMLSQDCATPGDTCVDGVCR